MIQNAAMVRDAGLRATLPSAVRVPGPQSPTIPRRTGGASRPGLAGKGVLILGWSRLARELIKELDARPHLRYFILGVMDDAMPDEVPYPYLGPLEDLPQIIREVRPDRIIVALAERRGRLPVHQLLVARVDGVLVEDGVEVYERLTGKLAIEVLTPSSLIFDKNFQTPRLALAIGRALSLAVSAVALVGLAPLLALIALAIKLDSRGPIFFIHERVGMGGKPFKLIKFRTMHTVEQGAAFWFQESRDRITRVGRWVRKFRLDELPQFLNVLLGHMNLVGPRPHRVRKFELLSLVARNTPESGEAVPYFSLRSAVRPGMTGWAQVRYHYAHDLEEEIEKLRYDLYYIRHMSLWFDLRILLETIKIVVLGRGASEASGGPDEASYRESEEAGDQSGAAITQSDDMRHRLLSPEPPSTRVESGKGHVRYSG